MQCTTCEEFFLPEPKSAVFHVLDRYYIEIRYPQPGDSVRARLCPLFLRLIQDIRDGQDIGEYANFNYYIDDHDMTFVCPRCHGESKTDFVLWLPDEFFLFIEDYIDFEVAGILLKYTGMTARASGIETLDRNQLDGFLSQLPSEYQDLRVLINRLFQTKELLPIRGGRGGGHEIIEWIADQVSAEVLGAMVSIVISSGMNGIIKQVRGIATRRNIRRKIRADSEYWDDISFDDLAKYMNVPKDFVGSKEKLIEKIIQNKVDSYKQRLIEKLRH